MNSHGARGRFVKLGKNALRVASNATLTFSAIALTFIAFFALAAQAQKQTPCCVVTAIDLKTGVATAKVNASGETFEFRTTNANLIRDLRIDQGVYANFKTREVSLDGKTIAGTIISVGSSIAPVAVPGAPAGRGGQQLLSNAPLPVMTLGDPRPVQVTQGPAPILPLRGRAESRTNTGTVGGRPVSAAVVHVRGVDGLENVSGLPEGVKTLLSLHVRKLPAGESDHYIINVTQAQEWARTHPVPADVIPTDVKKSDGHSGCKSFSWHCAQEASKHAEDETSRQADMLREQAQKDWDHAAAGLAKDWGETESCLADHTLHLDNIPVEFTLPIQMDIAAEMKGKTEDKSASGQITGTIGVGLPVKGNFKANVDVFYIPCMPFVVRPKAIGADGTMTVTTTLTGNLNASGTFDKTYPIPPNGGPCFPVQDIPIVILGVPLLNIEACVYVDGGIEVGGEGKLTASFEFDDPHQYAFNFDCSGHGCTHGKPPQTTPVSVTTTEKYKLEGQAFVKPDIYVALELDLDFDAAAVRAGPEPTLTGTLYGCGTATETNNLTTGHSTITESHALAFDLDWGLIFRMDFLVGGTKEGDGWNPSLVGKEHILFKDLWPGGSNAFLANVTEGAHGTLKNTSFNVAMPACYPFTENMHYRVTLPAGATGVASSSCSWTGVDGFCTGNPKKGLDFAVNWPASGTYPLTVVASEDAHLRTFKATPTTLSVAIK
ncbi:MAG TPA: hypothetical protein VEF05_12440 [Terriglobales bacterium]|nr:hypothetical protein [Terriglobales bacterium]